MTKPKDPSGEGPFSDSAELFESLFREAVLEDEQNPLQASKLRKGVGSGEDLKRKPQNRLQQAHRAAKNGAPARRRTEPPKKGNGIKPRTSVSMKRNGMTRRGSDLVLQRAGRVEKKGTGKSRVLQAALLLILLVGGGVLAASYLGYLDLGRPVGLLLGKKTPNSALPVARIREKTEAAQPVPSKPAPKKSEPEIALIESPPIVKKTPSLATQTENVPSKDPPARLETASSLPMSEATENLPEPAIQTTPPKPEEKAPALQRGSVQETAPSPTQIEPTKYPFSIFLGSFQSLDRTKKAVSIYERDHGISAYWVRVDLGDKGIWHRVFTGHFSNAKEADAFIEAKDAWRGGWIQTVLRRLQCS
jgi:hypothetical protein